MSRHNVYTRYPIKSSSNYIKKLFPKSQDLLTSTTKRNGQKTTNSNSLSIFPSPSSIRARTHYMDLERWPL